MKNRYQSIKGMKDIIPGESEKWLAFEKIIREWCTKYSYNNIRTPILENTSLFIRSIGEATDIVEKEMYSFTDSLNNEKLTLRPEGTAACLRACLENNLLYKTTQRLWYMGPMFRHEKPQKGRYRQFHQVGLEALGLQGPNIDAEMILMTKELWDTFNLKNVELQVNTLGNPIERKRHRDVLIKYLEKYYDVLDDDGKRRLYKNPLRVLDTKNPDLQEICQNAPKLIDYLDTESITHYEKWLTLLNKLEIPYTENRRLVRGLDYYNNSVFEWVSHENEQEITFCAGGRYNGLLEELGGEDLPGIGFAMGVERVIDMIDFSSINNKSIDAYIINSGNGTDEYSLLVSKKLRSLGLCVKQDFEENSLKAQIKRADKSGASLCVIIGENEINKNCITIKYMNTGVEKEVGLDELENSIKSIF